MEARAIQKYVRMSPRKVRVVATMVKNLKPQEAVEKLPFTKKRAAEPLKKVIISAIANAKEQGLNPDNLVFKHIQVGKGPTLKRWRPGARGRVKPYEKKMSQIKVVLEEEEEKGKLYKENRIAKQSMSKSKVDKKKKDGSKSKPEKKQAKSRSDKKSKKTKTTKKTKKKGDKK